MKTPEKITTIKDIALKAKVSIGTVDRVLHKRGRVAPDVEKKVLRIIKDADYQPNIIARTLVLKKTYHVAVLIPSDTSGSYWFAAKQGVEKASKELNKYGLKVKYYLFDPNDAQSFDTHAKAVGQENHDMIMVTPVFYRQALPFFANWNQRKIPFVCFNNQIPESDSLSYVGQDSYQSGYLAGKLIHYGQSSPCSVLIMHFNQETSNAIHLEKKEQGFKNYFQQNNLQQFDVLKVNITGSSFSEISEQLDAVFEEQPNIKGVFVSNAKAHEVAGYLVQKRKLEVKIVGYDLIPKNIYYLKQDVISFLINQNPKGQAYTAMQMIADQLIFDKAVPKLKYLPLDIVTKENLIYYTEDDAVLI